MLSDAMNKALNDQVKWEMYSSYLYLSMSAYFADLGMAGFAHWMRTQAQEELFHAMKFYDYINERGGRVQLQPIEAPQHTWKNTIDVFEETLKHEQHVTARINNLANLALDERDHATSIFLQWFISEQVEEEDSVKDVLGKLRMINGEGQGMLMLNNELGTRVFTPPVAE
ncbi:ferritin [Desulfovibrio mangrovi]|uniref:ferritin n=1 Tax=Desulfovibrio mangrovi TaxID=2976983 RepID=UPI002245BC46|nr:ferritin [Desulfovibrio mangrovi]UZP68515.1 ferritin [Desulfovibrio mangrovi]